MSDQDELRDDEALRDRIAKVLYGRSTHFAVYKRTWDEEMEGTEGYSDEIDSARDDAQAIIDEFGLTVETVGGFVSVAGNHDARRVVGKWERCD